MNTQFFALLAPSSSVVSLPPRNPAGALDEASALVVRSPGGPWAFFPRVGVWKSGSPLVTSALAGYGDYLAWEIGEAQARRLLLRLGQVLDPAFTVGEVIGPTRD